MINENRIVPVTATDLLTLYGNMFTIAGTSITAVSASSPGVFELTSGSGNLLADEPVDSFDIDSDVTSFTLYFIPGYSFSGFTVEGAAATIADNDVTVEADGRTLYKAVLSSGTITITKAGF